MANLVENSTWENGIYQLEQTDPVLGGPPNLALNEGFDNVPHQMLANRTQWLRDQIQTLQTALNNIDVSAQINAAINDLVNGAPGALDTLNELAAAIQSNDADIAAALAQLATAMNGANNLSEITDPAQARANIGAGAGTPIGAISPFYQDTAPAGWLVCDGSPVTSLYPELRAHLLAQAGVVTDANGDPFLPDLRGEFLRGLDNGRGVDAGRVLGSAQGDAIRNITGQIGTIGANGAITGAFRNIGAAGVLSNSGGADFQADFDASRVVPTAHENRPRNVAALYCIKAFDTVSLAGTADLAALLNSIATQSEAEQGTNNTDLMTPLRTKQAIAAQTSRVHIATATANNDAVIDFTGFDSSLYISYVFQYSSMTPQTSGGMLLFRFSTDGGVSYVDTASQYQRHNLGFSPTTASAGRLTDDIANGPVKPGASGEMTLHNPDIAGKQVQTSSLGARPSTNGLSYADVRANSSVFSGPVNGIRFFMDTGAIASGTIHMYGIPR